MKRLWNSIKGLPWKSAAKAAAQIIAPARYDPAGLV